MPSFKPGHRQYSMLLLLLGLCLLLSITTAIDSRYKWSLIAFNTSTVYETLPSCAQPCVSDVDDFLQCWSYGCVCSENTPGENFLNGTQYIQNCVRDGCPSSNESIINDGLSVFQSICGISDFDTLLNLSSTGTGTGMVTVTATQTGAVASATATSTFNPANAVMIDHPKSAYDALSPCVRWVLNDCKSPDDSAENCSPSRPGDHSDIWSGLGVHLQCETAECVCAGSRFFYSTQKLYERADLYCSIGFPYRGNESNPGFEDTITMLAEYCSYEGFVLGEWIVTLFGWERKSGLSQESKIAIGATIASAFLTIVSIWATCLVARRRKKNQT